MSGVICSVLQTLSLKLVAGLYKAVRMDKTSNIVQSSIVWYTVTTQASLVLLISIDANSEFLFNASACSWKDKHATGYESISDTGNVTCSQGYRPVHDANTPKCNQTTGAWEFTAVCEG